MAASTAAATSLRYVAHARFTASTLMLYYEELQAEPVRWLTVLASFIGVPSPSAEEMRAVARTNASAAKNRDVAMLLRVSVAAETAPFLSEAAVAQMDRVVCPVLVAPLRSRWMSRDSCDQ